jgi:hypothetical protein
MCTDLSITSNAKCQQPIPGKDLGTISFLQKVYFLPVILSFMAAKTHKVHVNSYVKEVPVKYPGTDPRTKAAHKEKK